MFLLVYVREELLRYVHDLDDSYVGVGIMNMVVCAGWPTWVWSAFCQGLAAFSYASLSIVMTFDSESWGFGDKHVAARFGLKCSLSGLCSFS